MTQSTYLHCAIFSGKSSLVRQELTFLSPSQKTMWIILATFVSSNAVFKPTGLGIDPVPFLQTHETLRQRMANHKSLDWEYATTMLTFQKAIRSLIFRTGKNTICTMFFLLLLFWGDLRSFCWLPKKVNWNTCFSRESFCEWKVLLTSGGLLYIFTSSLSFSLSLSLCCPLALCHGHSPSCSFLPEGCGPCRWGATKWPPFGT